MAEMPTTAFYDTPRGAVAAQLIRARARALWQPESMRGLDLLGLGYATPYLPLWQASAYRCIAAVTAEANRWPANGPNQTALVVEDLLPFPDLSFDRIFLIHGLEAADNARRLLREVWRLLRDDGKLMVVTPNRRGVWAHIETTPFGQGQPYSAGQIGRLLNASFFCVERRDAALYLPPLTFRAALRAAPMVESTGRRLAPRFGGVTITEAVKDAYGVLPLNPAHARRRVVMVDAA
jgi:SAM-dependent methyltransferase